MQSGDTEQLRSQHLEVILGRQMPWIIRWSFLIQLIVLISLLVFIVIPTQTTRISTKIVLSSEPPYQNAKGRIEIQSEWVQKLVDKKRIKLVTKGQSINRAYSLNIINRDCLRSGDGEKIYIRLPAEFLKKQFTFDLRRSRYIEVEIVFAPESIIDVILSGILSRN